MLDMFDAPFIRLTDRNRYRRSSSVRSPPVPRVWNRHCRRKFENPNMLDCLFPHRGSRLAGPFCKSATSALILARPQKHHWDNVPVETAVAFAFATKLARTDSAFYSRSHRALRAQARQRIKCLQTASSTSGYTVAAIFMAGPFSQDIPYIKRKRGLLTNVPSSER